MQAGAVKRGGAQTYRAIGAVRDDVNRIHTRAPGQELRDLLQPVLGGVQHKHFSPRCQTGQQGGQIGDVVFNKDDLCALRCRHGLHRRQQHGCLGRHGRWHIKAFNDSGISHPRLGIVGGVQGAVYRSAVKHQPRFEHQRHRARALQPALDQLDALRRSLGAIDTARASRLALALDGFRHRHISAGDFVPDVVKYAVHGQAFVGVSQGP